MSLFFFIFPMQPENPVTICPSAHHPLKLKQLFELHLQESRDDGDGSLLHSKKFECPSCMRVLGIQPSTASRKCGHVVCSECFKKFVKDTGRCFVCSIEVKEKDFIELEKGGTSFSGHSQVEQKVWNPSLQ
jgi:nitric oxide synthase-interacting protein